MSDDTYARAELADQIRDLAVKLHWQNMKVGGEHKALEFAEELQNKTVEYLSILLHQMRERGEDVSVNLPDLPVE